MKIGSIGCPETSVQNYNSTLRKIPKERSFHIHILVCDGALSCTQKHVCVCTGGDVASDLSSAVRRRHDNVILSGKNM
jgi:hypothetical protein